MACWAKEHCYGFMAECNPRWRDFSFTLQCINGTDVVVAILSLRGYLHTMLDYPALKSLSLPSGLMAQSRILFYLSEQAATDCREMIGSQNFLLVGSQLGKTGHG